MKKKLMTFVLLCTMALTACGTAENEATPTTKPTGAAVSESTESATTKPTDTPAGDAADVPAGEKTEAPVEEITNTPAEEVTDTPAQESASTPAPTEAPAEEVPDFGTVLMELHKLTTYEEREAYLAKLSKTAYAVNEADNADILTKSSGVATEYIYTFDLETEEYIKTAKPDSEIQYPVFERNILAYCCGLDLYYEDITEMPTGEYTLMTLTNLATGEVDPWGVKIYKAGAKVQEVENEWGIYTDTVIDPDSPVETVYVTVEEFVNAYNETGGVWFEGKATYHSPKYVYQGYDENWNLIDEYYVYETSVQTVYVEPEEVDSWEYGGETYYEYADEEVGYYEAFKDEEGRFYYVREDINEINIEERGYTIVKTEYGLYVLDADGNLVTEEEEIEDYFSAPMLSTWDTLKYYDSLYDAQLWMDFQEASYWEIYNIADMKAEDYPYVSADKFDSIIKQFMNVEGITLEEEILAIRASIPEEWDGYENYYDKAGVISMVNEDNSQVTVTINRPENWFFKNRENEEYYNEMYGYVKDGTHCNLEVSEPEFDVSSPRYSVNYAFMDIKTDLSKSEVEERWSRYFWVEPDLKSVEVNGITVFYYEESEEWMDLREIYVFQDVGAGKYVLIDITSYDMKESTPDVIGKFLLNGNYSIEQ